MTNPQHFEPASREREIYEAGSPPARHRDNRQAHAFVISCRRPMRRHTALGHAVTRPEDL